MIRKPWKVLTSGAVLWYSWSSGAYLFGRGSVLPAGLHRRSGSAPGGHDWTSGELLNRITHHQQWKWPQIFLVSLLSKITLCFSMSSETFSFFSICCNWYSVICHFHYLEFWIDMLLVPMFIVISHTPSHFLMNELHSQQCSSIKMHQELFLKDTFCKFV